jgi:NAD(P)-dependent dehydrogenase (short-subunit alcohol dehydrogenase family)
MAEPVAPSSSRPLAGHVAVVAGATRGAGRGIARALAEAGAFVYCTGRSVAGAPSPYQRPETIEETAALIAAAGGAAAALRVDHTVEPEVAALFERVDRDHGRLDVLVNSIAGEEPLLADWRRFWEIDLSKGDTILRQTVLSRMVTSKYAARLMVPRRHGLMVEITENDLITGSGNALAQVAKMAHRGMAMIFASELRAHGVASVALTPGFLRSERMLEHFGVTEDTWRDAGRKDSNFLESESPMFVGRAVVALAKDPDVLRHSGHILSSWELSRHYGFRDIDGRRPDWGEKEVDFTTLPPALCAAILDGLRFQRDWLGVLHERTDRYVTRWSAGLAAQAARAEPPVSPPANAQLSET